MTEYKLRYYNVPAQEKRKRGLYLNVLFLTNTWYYPKLPPNLNNKRKDLLVLVHKGEGLGFEAI